MATQTAFAISQIFVLLSVRSGNLDSRRLSFSTVVISSALTAEG